jgi:hypothetical protein
MLYTREMMLKPAAPKLAKNAKMLTSQMLGIHIKSKIAIPDRYTVNLMIFTLPTLLV